jgi:hypothetical protein
LRPGPVCIRLPARTIDLQEIVMPKLALEDIVDLRAYERERAEFLASVIELKKRRRIPVGPFVTLLFENARTIRFQIQEMARAEKIISDEGIETELRIYNPLIPDPEHLAATLFIELTSELALREWLPRLVGIESMVEFRLGWRDGDNTDRDDAVVVRCRVDAEHQKQLTREETTASVHYIHFDFTAEQIDAFATRPVSLAMTHADYQHETLLGPDAVAELLGDLRAGG